MSCAFDTAPTCCAATTPSLNSSSVGMLRTLYFGAVNGFSSIFNLMTFRRSPYSSATVPRTGAIILHGPHHSAQKSSKTGTSELTTSASKSLSVVCATRSLNLRLLQQDSVPRCVLRIVSAALKRLSKRNSK